MIIRQRARKKMRRAGAPGTRRPIHSLSRTEEEETLNRPAHTRVEVEREEQRQRQRHRPHLVSLDERNRARMAPGFQKQFSVDSFQFSVLACT
jgi:hypothetical protein